MEQAGADERRTWLRETLARYEGPLLRYAQRLTGDAEAARDVVQDVFSRLCVERKNTSENHVAAWLFAVCRNRAIDVRRKEDRMRPLPEAELDARPHPALSPAESAETRDALAGVLRGLATLPEKQQEAVRLKFQAGLSYKEIAGALELSVGNVGFLIHTALKTLREKMGVS